MNLSPFDLNLRHLRGISAIVANGSVSAAAEAVGLSQPALTQGLARLEAKLETALFVRQPGGMTPTQAGRMLAARASEAMARIGEAMQGLRRSGRGFERVETLLTATQLRALLMLAEGGSFVAAAMLTGLSQSIVHRAVRDIEKLIGVSLVERRGRGVALTEAGRRTARGFRLAQLAIAAGIAEVSSIGGDSVGLIRVGAMPLARARLLPEAISRLHADYPWAQFSVIEGAHRELIDQLRDGHVDLTIGALRDPCPGPDIVQRPLFVDRLAVVARADHPLVRSGAADREAIAAYPWIITATGTPLRAHWDRLFAGGRLPEAPIECGSVMTIRGLLLSGDYLTLLSPDQLWLELRSGLLAQIETPFFDGPRTIGTTIRRDWRPTRVQEAFLTALAAVAQDGLTENQ